LPKEIEFLISDDGKTFTSIGKTTVKDNRFAKLQITKIKTTYVKIIATNFGNIPTGNPGAGEPAWLFCDEIQIQ
jgi:hexosaminidase